MQCVCVCVCVCSCAAEEATRDDLAKQVTTKEMFPIGCCSICFDPLTTAASTASTDSVDGVSAAACGHVFHTNCVAKWTAASNGDCPQCRQRISEGSLLTLFLVQDGNGGQFSSASAARGADEEYGNHKNVTHEDEEQVVQV